jgi:transcriptional regulator with XRE-family HTH domain
MIGTNLKKLRKEKGVTQTEVAIFLGVRQNTYSQYESDSRQPDIESLVKLATFYDVSLDIIVGVDTREVNNKLDIEKFVDVLVTQLNKDERLSTMSSLDVRSYALEMVKDELTKKLLKDENE